jgi:hypothetical protein
MLVAAYGTGNVGVPRLNLELHHVWKEILGDALMRKQAAQALGMLPDEFAKAYPNSPFQFTAKEAGFGPVETAILVFVTAVAHDVIKDVAKDAAKTAFVSLWEIIKPKVEWNLPPNALGPESETNGAEDLRLPPT